MSNPFLPFARPDCSEEEISEVAATLRSGWITSGPRVDRFEREFAQYVGAGHALAGNSFTAGVPLAGVACGVATRAACRLPHLPRAGPGGLVAADHVTAEAGHLLPLRGELQQHQAHARPLIGTQPPENR